MKEVIVSSNINQEYQQEVKAGTHKFIADVPQDAGGQGTGPDPHELLLGALGSCTSITLQMFAKKRGWDLKHVVVKLSEEKIADPADATKQISKITRNIEVEGNLDAEQLQSLQSIADKCQIHKLLVGQKEITTSLSQPSHV